MGDIFLFIACYHNYPSATYVRIESFFFLFFTHIYYDKHQRYRKFYSFFPFFPSFDMNTTSQSTNYIHISQELIETLEYDINSLRKLQQSYFLFFMHPNFYASRFSVNLSRRSDYQNIKIFRIPDISSSRKNKNTNLYNKIEKEEEKLIIGLDNIKKSKLVLCSYQISIQETILFQTKYYLDLQSFIFFSFFIVDVFQSWLKLRNLLCYSHIICSVMLVKISFDVKI